MHTNSGPRYAIYFTPDPESALWRFGCAAIGYDAARACAVDGLDHPVLRTELAVAYREAPARYGFHVTLKAPFALAAGTTLDDLLGSARDFASLRRRVLLPGLAVTALGSFLALMLLDSTQGVGELADACVRDFERFRTPLVEADRQRRLAAALTPRQKAHLERWGYPYVSEDFRFHMTLTDALPSAVRSDVGKAFAELYAGISGPK